jgi:predicted DNA-binding transcriptional regulator YafY
VRFAPEVAGEVREMVWHPDQKIEVQPDGSAVLELPGESLREARRFVLAYGRHATALSPPELVADLAAETGAMAGLYAGAPAAGKAADPSAGRNKRPVGRRSE